jgi:hypothetical protein
MHRKWLFSSSVSWILLACALSVLIVAEATVIVASLGLPNVHTPLGTARLLASVLFTSIPGIAGVRGYYMVKRLRPASDLEQEKTIVPLLSRQFLFTAIAAYAAIVMNVIFLTEALRTK